MAGRSRTAVRGVVLLGALCSLAVAGPFPSTRADEPVPVSIIIHDFLISEDTAVGTFEASGGVEAAGLESQVSRVNGQSLHCVHTLVAEGGTIVIHSQCNLVTNVGQWRIVSGTGAYAGLRGSGSLVMVFNPDDPAEAFEILDGKVH